jgi:hypothetical protein
MRGQRLEPMQWPIPSCSQTGQSGFSRIRTEEDVEDYRARDGTSTPLVSSRTHVQPEEEDLTNEGVEVEGGSGREGKRRTLQHYLAYVSDKARVEGERESHHPCTHGLQ